ncbi:MAG: type I restriction enzyme HsdR N-terminal domain-containing protein [Bacteroidota bacterium]|jgi:hypothetical protein
MLTNSKKKKLMVHLRDYHKKYLEKKLTDLDESGTRLMVNTFLTDVLGFAAIEEVKTEYMIKGTYADYVIQTKGNRHFLVEVKSLSLNLTEKHLRQAVNYGANEGIEWALLTNGKNFELYRILFNKPINERLVFSIDLSNRKLLKDSLEHLQYLDRDSVSHHGLDQLWNRCVALDPSNISKLILAPQVINFVRRTLKRKFKAKFTNHEVVNSLKRVIYEVVPFEEIKKTKTRKKNKSNKPPSIATPSEVIAPQNTQ